MSKAKSFAALKAEIAALEAQAAEARRREMAEVLADIKSKIATYGLTAADLGLRGFGPAPKAKKGVVIPAAKYRDPKSGQTWTGRGRAPGWLAGVKNRDAFLIKPSSLVVAPVAKTVTAKAAPKKKAVPAKPVKLAVARNVTKAAGKKKAPKKVGAKSVAAAAPTTAAVAA